MSKDVITIHGEQRVVREDEAKAYRGLNWALISIAAFILIAAILFLSSVLTGVFYQPQQPADSVPVEREVAP